MQTYIEHLRELFTKEQSLSVPLPINLQVVYAVLEAFDDELKYIQYKHFKDSSVNVDMEISKLKSLYLFNPIILHSYNVSNSEISVCNIIEKCAQGDNNLTLGEVIFTCDPKMQKYSFYDGVPVKVIMKELEYKKRHLFFMKFLHFISEQIDKFM